MLKVVERMWKHSKAGQSKFSIPPIPKPSVTGGYGLVQARPAIAFRPSALLTTFEASGSTI